MSLVNWGKNLKNMHQPSLYWLALVNNSFAANFQATNLFWINFILFQKQRYCCQTAGIHTRNQLIKLLGNIKQAWYNLYLVKILFYYHTQVPYTVEALGVPNFNELSPIVGKNCWPFKFCSTRTPKLCICKSRRLSNFMRSFKQKYCLFA